MVATGTDGTTGPRFRDRAAYLPAADALVLADLHVGRDATSNVQLSMGERADLRDRLAALVERFDPAEVVLAGDLLHSFGDLPRGVEGTVLDLLEAVHGGGAEAVVLRGNHDSMLDSVYPGAIHDEYRLADGDTVVCHGHRDPETTDGVRRYVIGHDHPAIEIEGRRRPCYLLGRDAHARTGADVLVVPAFTRLAAGTPVNAATGADMHSAFVTNLDAFRPIVRDEDADETLRFPPLGQFRKML